MKQRRDETEIYSSAACRRQETTLIPDAHFAFRRQTLRDRQLLEKNFDKRGAGVPDNPCQIKSGISGALEQAEYDLIISDFTLPGNSGIAPPHRQQGLQPDTPFIFCPGSIGEEQVVDKPESGATEFCS